MRQVGLHELIDMIQSALRRLSSSQIGAMRDWRPAERLRGRLLAAETIARDLQRLEILSNAPPPPPYHYADLEGRSGVPPVDENDGSAAHDRGPS